MPLVSRGQLLVGRIVDAMKSYLISFKVLTPIAYDLAFGFMVFFKAVLLVGIFLKNFKDVVRRHFFLNNVDSWMTIFLQGKAINKLVAKYDLNENKTTEDPKL